MDARSLSDFFSHNGYGCPLPMQAATAAAAADGSAVCFSLGLTCLAAWVKNEFDADAVGRNSPSGPKQPLITNLHTGPKQPLSPTGLGKISATFRADLTSRRGDPCRNVAPAHPSPQGTAETTEPAERLLFSLPLLGRRCLLVSVVG